MLRIASSRVVGNALRVVASPRISITNYEFSSINQNSRFRRHINSVSLPNLSADGNKRQIDRKLVEILKSELKSDQRPPLETILPPIPPDFPFTIEDKPTCDEVLTLTREFAGEEIEVLVLNTRSEDEESDTDCNDNNSDDDEKEKSDLDLSVLISKGNGIKMNFKVSVSTDEIINIQTISAFEPAAETDDPWLCFGPLPVKEDSELQFALREYLEIRGLKKSYAEFLCKYMVRKSKRTQYNQVLVEMKEFIEKH